MKIRINTVALILFGIISVGIFLRTYQFHDWLRFNADQSRDASLVSHVVDGNVAWPLLGPKAGGTTFKLGGAFYYLQIVSAKVFGNSPDKMAYPDLFASILTIPLLFLLMRRAFQARTALLLTAGLSVSVFAIKYARFAWNPNSAPLYSILFLYALLAIADAKTVKKLRWALVAGVALGIGVQLHTVLLVVMPITALLFFMFIGRKTPSLWRPAAIVFAVAFALNIGQVIDLAQTNGANVKAFFGATTTKTANGKTLLGDLATDAVCQAQADAFIISGIGNDDECGTDMVISTYQKAKGLSGKLPFLVGLFLSVLFSVGGAWLWIRAIRKSTDGQVKLFLQLTGMYALINFILFIPLANEISLRFYLASMFVPFILLGLWIEALSVFSGTYRKQMLIATLSILAIVLCTNSMAVWTAFLDHSGKTLVSGSTSTEITLGEVEGIAEYITSHFQSGETVLLKGKQTYIFKYLKSIEYFTAQKGVALKPLSKKKQLTGSEPIVLIGNAKSKGKLTKSVAETYSAPDFGIYGRFSIEQLIRK